MTDATLLIQTLMILLKLVSYLNNVGAMVTYEVKPILILCSLSSRYNQLKETLKYAKKNTIILEAMIVAARDKTKSNLKYNGWSSKEAGEGLDMKDHHQDRGKSEWRNGSKKDNYGRSRSRSKVVCWYCKKERHLKKVWFALKISLEGWNKVKRLLSQNNFSILMQ